MPKLDPGHTRPIYIVGFSNGGRLAYRMACTYLTLFDGLAAVKADPMPGCAVTKPMNVIVFSSQNDKYVPFEPGEKGYETPAATVQIATLENDLGCSTKPTVAKYDQPKARYGAMTVSTWSCADGKTLSGRSIRTASMASPTQGPSGQAPTSSSTPGSRRCRWPRCPPGAPEPAPDLPGNRLAEDPAERVDEVLAVGAPIPVMVSYPVRVTWPV